jgi:hypothetical protein
MYLFQNMLHTLITPKRRLTKRRRSTGSAHLTSAHNIVPVYSVKLYKCSQDIAPLFLKFVIRQRQAISFCLRSFRPTGRNIQYAFRAIQAGPKGGHDVLEKRNRAPYRPTPTLVTTQTTLYLLTPLPPPPGLNRPIIKSIA